MEVGCVVLLNNGTKQERYMVTTKDTRGYILRRCKTPKSKADANRFAETIYITIEFKSLNQSN